MKEQKIKPKTKKSTKTKTLAIPEMVSSMADSLPALILLNEFVDNRDSILFLVDILNARHTEKLKDNIDEDGYFLYNGDLLAKRMNLRPNQKNHAIRHLSDIRLISKRQGKANKSRVRVNDEELLLLERRSWR